MKDEYIGKSVNTEEFVPLDNLQYGRSILAASLKILDLPILFTVSVRLANCIKRQNKEFDVSLAETLDAPNLHLGRLKSVVSQFGEQSCVEILDYSKAVYETALQVGDNENKFCERLSISNPAAIELINERLSLHQENDGVSVSLGAAGKAKYLKRTEIAACFDSLPVRRTIEYFNVSARLQNSISRNAARLDNIYPNFQELISRNQVFAIWFPGLGNVGQKTINEVRKLFIEIIHTLIISSENVEKGEPRWDELRLFSEELVISKKEFFSADLLKNGLKGLNEVVSSLEGEYNLADTNDDLLLLLSLMERDPVIALEQYLSRFLSVRACDVLNRRFGFKRARQQTLQEVADVYGMTRERIRQVEAKAIREFTVPFHRAFFSHILDFHKREWFESFVSNRKTIHLDQCREIENHSPGYIQLALRVRFGNVTNYLDHNYETINDGEKRIGWLISPLEVGEAERVKEAFLSAGGQASNILSNLKLVLGDTSWPIRLEELFKVLPIYSEEEIISSIENDLGGKIENGVITRLGGLTAKLRLIITLRSIGRPAHLSAIKRRHNSIFIEETTEHAAGSVLARLEEALIVDRGCYGLYEHLSLSESEVSEVADYCYIQVGEKGVYVSAKILAKELAQSLEHLASRLTPYLVLGICQDDIRFDIKRGLMIGLADEGFHSDFTSLTESLREVVINQGPISITQIMNVLSDTRDLIYVTINMMLESLDDVIRVAPGIFDYMPRSIGKKAEVNKIINALTVCLVDAPCSLHVLSSRISALGYQIDKIALFSLLRKFDQFVVEDRMIILDEPSTNLEKYNELFHKYFTPKQSLEVNKNKLDEIITEEQLRLFFEVDFRLFTPPETWQSGTANDDEDDTVIDEILKDFGF